MKGFEVWHRTPYIPMIVAPDISSFSEKDYEKVAFVFCETMGDAFRLTNHIDRSWWYNEEVKWCIEGKRSTSVGDVIIERNWPDEPIKGKPVVVEGLGFRKLKIE